MRWGKCRLYAAASVETCRQYPGSQGHEVVDATTFADWGADFAKLDSCSDAPLANGTESWWNQHVTRASNSGDRSAVVE